MDPEVRNLRRSSIRYPQGRGVALDVLGNAIYDLRRPSAALPAAAADTATAPFPAEASEALCSVTLFASMMCGAMLLCVLYLYHAVLHVRL